MMRSQKEISDKIFDVAYNSRNLFEHTPIAYQSLNKNGYLIDVNKFWLELMGHDREEVIESWFGDFLSSGEVKKFEKRFTIFKKKGRVDNLEFKMIKKDGSEIIVLFFGEIEKDDGGAFVRTHCVFLDITERKKIERELKIKESAIDSSINAIFIADLNGEIKYVNESFLVMWGYSMDEVVGTPAIKFWRTKGYATHMLDTIRQTGVWVGELTAEKKDGSTFDVQLSANMVKDEKNDPLCYMASFVDITDKNKSQKELKKEKESAERYLNLAGSIILALDTKGNIVLINKKGHQILGYKSNEIIGKNWFETFIPKDDIKELKKVFSELIKGKTESVEHYVNTVVTGKGDLRLIRWYNTILRDSSGNINGILSSGEDITDYKKAEQEIIQTKDYLQNIINSASEIIISIDKNLKVSLWNKKSEFLTGISQKQIIGKLISKANVIVNFVEFKESISSILKEKSAKFDELVLVTNKGDKKIIRCSLSAIKSNENKIKGVLILGRDITRDIGAHGKLIQGNSYLIYDKTNNSSVDLLIDVTRSKYHGFFITRYRPGTKHDLITSPNIDVAILSYQKINDFDNIYDLDLLERRIEEFCKKYQNGVVLLDRVDFLISNFTFDNFIKTLYRINNIIVKYKSILLIHLIPDLLDKKQQTIIEQECQFLPSQKIEDIHIDDNLFSILSYVYSQSANNTIISFKKISSQFSIVRATTNKRLKILEYLGLLYIKKQGRLKTLHLTEKGRTLLNKRITL